MAKCSETRKDGQPCTAPAVREGKCAGHAGLGISKDPVAMQKRSAEAKRNKAALRNRTAAEHLEAALQAKATNIVNAAVDAAENGDWRAGAWLYERVYGKPTERVEHAEGADVRELPESERVKLREAAVRKLTLVDSSDDTLEEKAG